MRYFEKIITAHQARYPNMAPQDYGKLAFQSEFGPEHMAPSRERVYDYLTREWQTVTDSHYEAEDIGNGLCRFHLGGRPDPDAIGLLTELFLRTAQSHTGRAEGLERRLTYLETLDVPGMREWLADYRAKGCPAVHHSDVFRDEYEPHYRVIDRNYANWFPAILDIWRLRDKQAVVAIDGRCGSGKTGLAAVLSELFDCAVFHSDDFYLPLDQREENWEQIPAGNMDLIRFLEEVVSPARQGKEVCYRPYDCQSGTVQEGRTAAPHKLTVIEGSYSHHPALADFYDRKIFVTCRNDVRNARLQEREGDYFPMFLKRWIPMEERYFSKYGIEENSDLVVDTTGFFE